jgi:DNA-binding cell septation regulator SpoVG
MTVTEERIARKIEVIAISPLANAGNLKAVVSVRLGGVIIHDCKIIQQPNQHAWVSLPQREYQQDGERKYKAVVEMTEPLRRELSRIVLATWERGGAA